VIKNKEKNFISVVIYIRNEEKRIRQFLKVIYNVLQINYEKFEIICVDDASNDDSKEEIRGFLHQIENSDTPPPPVQYQLYQLLICHHIRV